MGYDLLTFLAKGVGLLALAALVAVLLRRQSAAARHLVWTLAFAGMLALPLTSLSLPKLHVAWSAPGPPVETSATPMPMNNAAPMQPSQQPPPPTAVSPAGAPSSAATPARSIPWPVVLPLVWLTGTLGLLAHLALGHLFVARYLRPLPILATKDWEALLASCRQCLGISGAVRLLEAQPGAMPMAAGLLRPVVALPANAHDWPETQRRAVLLHELAHVKRRDCLTHALSRAALALHWPNPLAWYAARRLRIERERACDDAVLSAGAAPAAYAEHLLQVARSLRADALTAAAAVTMAKPSQLEGRLLAVLDAARNRRSVRRGAALAGIVILLAVALPLSALAIGRETEPAEETPQAGLYRAEFDHGVTVEVVMVAEHSEDPDRLAWRPDGTPLEEIPEAYRERRGGVAAEQGTNFARELGIQVDVIEPNASPSVKFGLPGSSSVATSGAPSRGFRMAATFPLGAQAAEVRVGVAAGAWKTVLTTTPRSSHGMGAAPNNWMDPFDVTVSDVMLKDGIPCVVFTSNIDDVDFRIAAVDEAGNHLEPRQGGGAGVGGFTSYQFIFPGAEDSADIDRIELQARPYEWKTLEGIALHPEVGVANAAQPLASESSFDITVRVQESELPKQQEWPEPRIVAIGRPAKWPNKWWDFEGRRVEPSRNWQSQEKAQAGGAALAVLVDSPNRAGTTSYSLREEVEDVRYGLGIASNSEAGPELLLYTTNDDEFGKYLDAGGTVHLTASYSIGNWVELGKLRRGATLETDEGTVTWALDKEENRSGPREADAKPFTRVDLTADFDTRWDLTIVPEAKGGERGAMRENTIHSMVWPGFAFICPNSPPLLAGLSPASPGRAGPLYGLLGSLMGRTGLCGMQAEVSQKEAS